MYIDTHAHYDYAGMREMRETLVPELPAHGIDCVITPAIRFESNYNMRIQLPFPFVYYSVGIHPKYAVTMTQDEAAERLKVLDRLARNSERTAAVGEAGFDFYWRPRTEVLEIQEMLFRGQIELAERHGLPLILHIRNADEDGLRVLRSYPLTASGVVHCFQGSWETAQKYLALGLKFGIGGAVTYPEAEALRDAVRRMPADALLLETDAPFMRPIGWEGDNSSLSLPQIAAEIAALRGQTLAEIAQITSENARALFPVIAG